MSRPCKICDGSREEHFDEEGRPKTQHMYNPDNTDMITQAQAQQAARRQLAQGYVQQQGRVETDSRAHHRLVEVLFDLAIIDHEDIIYIAGYTNEKPSRPKPSGYRDPSMIDVTAAVGGR